MATGSMNIQASFINASAGMWLIITARKRIIVQVATNNEAKKGGQMTLNQYLILILIVGVLWIASMVWRK